MTRISTGGLGYEIKDRQMTKSNAHERHKPKKKKKNNLRDQSMITSINNIKIMIKVYNRAHKQKLIDSKNLQV